MCEGNSVPQDTVLTDPQVRGDSARFWWAVALRRAGTLKRRGDRKWLIRLDHGRDANNNRIRLNRTITGTKKDAERALNQMLRDRDLGLLSTASRQPLSEYLDHWLKTAAAPRLRPGTLTDYEYVLERYIRPTLGSLYLHQVSPIAIQSTYAGMLDRSLSPRTVRYAHAVLRNALQQAVKWRMLPSNPADAVDLPKQQKKQMRALSEEEAQRFLAATQSSEHYAFFALLVGTGLRPGEAIALRWSDRDLQGDRLTVTRSARRAGKTWRYSEPKTSAGRRTVDLPPDLTQLLNNLPRHSELVFPNADGDPIALGTLTKREFKSALERAGLPSSIRLYDLRHTHATLLLLANVHPKIVATRLGHADVGVTLNTYSHVLPGMQREGARAINAMLFETTSAEVAKGVN